MQIDRKSPPNAARLLRFIKAARDSASSPIKHLTRFTRLAHEQIAGPWWKTVYSLGMRPADTRRPISYLGETIRTLHPHLMGDTLLPVVNPAGIGKRAEANLLQMRLRQWCDDAKYQEQDEIAALNALIGLSVQYVFRNAGGQVFADGNEKLDVGQPGVMTIPIDRMVIDPNAESWESPAGIGHWILVDRQAMLEHGIGDPDLLNALPNSWEATQEREDSEKEDSARNSEDTHLEDTVLLWEFTYRYAGRLFRCTLPPINGKEGFIVEPYEPLDEPEGSPYIVTALNSLPGSLEPVSPAIVLMDSHLAKSAIVAKLVKQIEDLQRKYAIAPGMQDAVMRLQEPGGDSHVVCDPDKIREFVQGGMVKELVDGLAFMETIGEKVGPNVNVLAGQQGPASESATSTSIRAGNGAVVMNYWKGKINKGRSEVLRRVSAMLLQGQDRRTFEMPVGQGQSVEIVWDPTTMDVSYDMFKYAIKPSGSSAGMDTRAKLRSLAELFQVIPSMMQVTLGIGGDPTKVIRVISDLAEMPEIDEILPTGDMASIQMQLLQMLNQGGKANIVGAQPMGGNTPLPAPGPMGQQAQLQSDAARAVPA